MRIKHTDSGPVSIGTVKSKISVCAVLVLLMGFASACVQIGIAPIRTAHAIYYTDGTCTYSFDGLRYGPREDHQIEEIEFAEFDIYQCIHEKAHKSGSWLPDRKELDPEIWPSVALWVKLERPELWGGANAFISPMDTRSFEISDYKLLDGERYAQRSYDRQFNSLFYFMGSDQRNFDAANIGDTERRMPCGKYYNTADANNRVTVYGAKERQRNGVLMEIKTNIKMVRNGC